MGTLEATVAQRRKVHQLERNLARKEWALAGPDTLLTLSQ